MENKTKNSKFTNLEPNVAAALSYVLTPFTGIYFFLVEKEDKYVRFHAFQSILFGVAAYMAWILATSLIMVLVGVLLVPIVSAATLILYVFLMWKAYNGEKFELPIIGKIAKEQSNK